MAQIQKTTDYGKFITTAGNRLIMKTHLANLTKSIRSRNLLHLNPIIVNEKLEVIDGQHRLLAAESLEVGIYFVQEEGLTLNDVVLLNTTAKQWRLDDYLTSYIARGYKEYIKVKKFANRWGISTSNALAILSSDEDGRIHAPYSVFKEGKFEIADEKLAEEFIKRLKEISAFTVEYAWKDREFMRALFYLYYREGIDHDVLVDKIKRWPKLISRRQSTREYSRQLEDIYNQDVPGRLKVRFD